MRPGLIDVLTSTPKIAPYFDLSFQHSAPGVLRAMRRFGDTDRFLELLDTIRSKAPQAGVRSNFIVGFPGESADDLAELERFLNGARLDAIGVFGYSDEEGTEAATYENKLEEDVVAERLARVSRLAEEPSSHSVPRNASARPCTSSWSPWTTRVCTAAARIRHRRRTARCCSRAAKV